MSSGLLITLRRYEWIQSSYCIITLYLTYHYRFVIHLPSHCVLWMCCDPNCWNSPMFQCYMCKCVFVYRVYLVWLVSPAGFSPWCQVERNQHLHSQLLGLHLAFIHLTQHKTLCCLLHCAKRPAFHHEQPHTMWLQWVPFLNAWQTTVSSSKLSHQNTHTDESVQTYNK